MTIITSSVVHWFLFNEIINGRKNNVHLNRHCCLSRSPPTTFAIASQSTVPLGPVVWYCSYAVFNNSSSAGVNGFLDSDSVTIRVFYNII